MKPRLVVGSRHAEIERGYDLACGTDPLNDRYMLRARDRQRYAEDAEYRQLCLERRRRNGRVPNADTVTGNNFVASPLAEGK